jgi:hypothetical protein
MKKLFLILVFILAYNFTDKDLVKIREHPATTLGPLVGLNKLTTLHDKWIIDVWVNKLPLQAHRGSYKTTSVTQVGSLWWHLFHPDDRIGIYRKPYTEAANTVRTITKFYEFEAIQELFYFAHGIYPKFKQKREESIEFNFKSTTTNEGSLNAYSIDKVKTGTHLDEAMCDDFVTLEDRISKAIRKRTDQGLMELNANIMDPGQIPGYIGTPWHPKDGWNQVPGDIQKYDINATGLLSKEQVEDIKSKTTSSLFACNYLLKHIANEDAIFKDPIWGPWDYKIGPVYGHLDAKYSGDHTNGLTFMAKRPDGFIQAIGFTSGQHVDKYKNIIAEKYHRFRTKRLYNEKNADKGYVAKELRNEEKLNVETYDEKMNKHIKIVAFLKKYWNTLIWDPNTDPEYMNQILDYMEKQEPDDCPDSAASLLREAFYREDDMSLWTL